MTTEYKHTPGPWEYARTDQYDQSVDVFESKTARTLVRTINSLPRKEQEANAQLIAAAPDLLDALEKTLSWLTSYPGEGALKAYEQAQAAIAKATGKGGSMSEPNLTLGALDSLALALAEHGHSWTDGERAIYELAIDKLTGKPTHACNGCYDLGVRLNIRGEIERCDSCERYRSDFDAWLSAKPV